MKIEFNYQNSVITLPAAAAEKLETASEQDLKVLLCVAAGVGRGEDFDAAKLAVRLEIPERDVENAISFWRGAGVLKTSRTKKKREESEEESASARPAGSAVPAPLTMQNGVPSYTGRELEQLMKERARLGQLLEECQKILDRVFNVNESNLCVALCDIMHFDDDYILLLCNYCREKADKATMKYVYNTAYRLYEENVLTVQQLEDYIAADEAKRSFENDMRKLFGLGGRKLTAKESKFFEAWRSFGFPREVVACAYEITVDATHEASMPYINKILTDWKKAGVKTLEEAKAESQRSKQTFAKQFPSKSRKDEGKKEEFTSFDPNEFFNKAIGSSLAGGREKGEEQ